MISKMLCMAELGCQAKEKLFFLLVLLIVHHIETYDERWSKFIKYPILHLRKQNQAKNGI